MSILVDLLQGLFKVLCGSKGDQLPAAQEQYTPPKQQQAWQGQSQPRHQLQQPQPYHPPSSLPQVKPPQQHPHSNVLAPHEHGLGQSPARENGQPHAHPFPPVSHNTSPPHTSPPHISPPHTSPHGHGHHEDHNQVNQHNEHYVSLRARANDEGHKMAECFEQSHEAHQNGDDALSKKLSNQGKEHQRKMDELNKEASDWIFAENNKESKPGEMDLHGLYVKEAIAHTNQAILDAQNRGLSELHLIVGKGLHSPGGVAKVKPAIEDFMRNHQLVSEIDPHNSGVLIVRIDGTRGAGRALVGPDDVARKLESSDETCVIM